VPPLYLYYRHILMVLARQRYSLTFHLRVEARLLRCILFVGLLDRRPASAHERSAKVGVTETVEAAGFSH
jgi:hypothetical protein